MASAGLADLGHLPSVSTPELMADPDNQLGPTFNDAEARILNTVSQVTTSTRSYV